MHGNFNEEERGEPGKFSFQFILDNGADEYVLRPTVDDGRLIMQMINEVESMYFVCDHVRDARSHARGKE